MKKTMKILLLAGMAILLLSVSALAADGMRCVNVGGTLAYEAGTYTASYEATGAENGYALLVVKVDPSLAKKLIAGTETGGWEIKEENILYIDQQDEADFTFVPMSEEPAVVLLGGAEQSPAIIGVLDTAPAGKPGDVTNDDNIDAQDRTLLAHYVGKWNDTQDKRLASLAEYILERGDITGDDNIDAQDRTLLAHYVGKWNDTQDKRLTAYKEKIGE